MPTTMKSLGLDRLSVAERILLVEELRDSIASETPEAITLSDAQKADLRRRLDDPKAGSPWEEVERRLREARR